MTRTRLIACSGLLIAPLALTQGCTRDEIAPDCFNRDPMTGECTVINPSLGGALDIECGSAEDPLPVGAVGAEYFYTVTANGNSLTFSAEGLPEGMSIDASTGVISGVPAEGTDGTYTDVRVTVVNNNTGVTDAKTCNEMQINPRLSFAYAGEARGCFAGDGALEDIIIDGTGTGAGITCSVTETGDPTSTCPLGDGNGRLPSGLGVTDDCQITGTNSENVVGTTVWMVRVEQSGGEAWVPFCDTVEPDADPFHSISVDFPGTDNDPLDPALENYDPSLALDFGMGVDNGPTFDIAAADCSGGACNFFGLFAQLYCSPFNLPLSTDPSTGDPMVGFEHDLFLSTQGETVESQNTNNNDYTIRPWVANVSLFYCTADNETTCGTNPPDTDAIQSNAQTRYNYAVIASPQ